MIRLLIADDHKLVREGFRVILKREEDFRVIGEARDGLEAIGLAQELHPDVITMDLQMPCLNGLEATKRIRAAQADIRILIVAMSWDATLLRQAIVVGASGYVAKSDLTELGAAVRTVYDNKRYFSRTITSFLAADNISLPQ